MGKRWSGGLAGVSVWSVAGRGICGLELCVLACWRVGLFASESHNYRIATKSRRWRLELRVHVAKLQKSKDGDFGSAHR